MLVALGDSLYNIIAPYSNKSILITFKWRIVGVFAYPEKNIMLFIHQLIITIYIFTRRAGVYPHTVLFTPSK